MVTLRPSYKSYMNEYSCISTDDKPSGEHVKNGSSLREIDTGKRYMFDAEHQTWLEVSGVLIPAQERNESESGSGSGGGGGLPAVTATDNGKALIVENGEWSVNVDADKGYRIVTEKEVLYNNTVSFMPISVMNMYYATVTNADLSTILLDEIPDYIYFTLDNEETISMPYNDLYDDGSDDYGEMDGGSAPSFENYPVWVSLTRSTGRIYIASQEDLTGHNIKIEFDKPGIETTDTFEAAVNSVIDEHGGADWAAASGTGGYIDNKPAIKRGYNSSTQQEVPTAIAEGLSSNVASGLYSHAEGGWYTEDDGDGYEVSYPTRAIGDSSHAEGSSTTASGYASHAEGANTTASATDSHAEGWYTTASAQGAHAEGSETVASGAKSHAEGSNTTASGQYAHAEGQTTTASKSSAHAEGNTTVASGACSHAEGASTIANHRAQHVFGAFNIADTHSSNADYNGNYIEIVGNGTGNNARSNARTLDWSGNEVLAGNLTVTGGSLTLGNTTFNAQDFSGGLQNLVDGNTSGSVRGINTIPEDNNYAMGTNAFAGGFGTKAIGSNAHAEGYLSEASGSNAHAEGDHTIAKNRAQHTFGSYNIADPSANSYSHKGTYVEIVGNGTAQNARSNARTLDWDGNEVLAGKLTVGAVPTNNMDVATKQYVDTAVSNAGGGGAADWTAASGASGYIDNKPAINRGYNSSTQQEVSTAIVEGLSFNVASGAYSHAEGGDYTEDDGDGNEVFYSTRAIGISSHAEGSATTASGYASHAEGCQTMASSAQAHAEGWHTTASGVKSHAEGHEAVASGQSSHAEGNSTTASASNAHAEGYGTTASRGDSHAEGSLTTASGGASHAEGVYTIANHQAQHVFGTYNIADPSSANPDTKGNYVEIVGNGVGDNTRSNARTLDWQGNEWLAGNFSIASGKSITIGSTTITEAQLQALLATLS